MSQRWSVSTWFTFLIRQNIIRCWNGMLHGISRDKQIELRQDQQIYIDLWFWVLCKCSDKNEEAIRRRSKSLTIKQDEYIHIHTSGSIQLLNMYKSLTQVFLFATCLVGLIGSSQAACPKFTTKPDFDYLQV